MKDVCIFGDSIVWGANDDKNGGWVELLKRDFYSKHDVLVYNLGISGDTTNELLQRFENECSAREAQGILIRIGTNDSAILDGKRRVELKEFDNNLKKLIKIARKFTDKIVFVGLLGCENSKVKPTSWWDTLFYDNDDLKKYDEKIKEVCSKEKVGFIDVFGILSSKDLDDGLHPNAKGHQKIFEKVREFLDYSSFLD